MISSGLMVIYLLGFTFPANLRCTTVCEVSNQFHFNKFRIHTAEDHQRFPVGIKIIPNPLPKFYDRFHSMHVIRDQKRGISGLQFRPMNKVSE
ncbi:unnamed protein product, partial [Schistosoma turkestanicum]